MPELGAGTGGTTTYLIDKLASCGQEFRYIFIDISSSFVAAAQKKFQNYDFMEYALVDIEQPLAPQNLGNMILLYQLIVSKYRVRNIYTEPSNTGMHIHPESNAETK